MILRKLFFVLATLIVATTAFAQDKIIKKNGDIIEAKVLVINTDIITFKKFDNLNGPEYSIPKADVMKIKYSNGTEDVFEENDDKIGIKSAGETRNLRGKTYKERIRMNNNIVALAPLQVTEFGMGVGLTWEHTLDKGGWVTFYLPVMVCFQNSQTTNSDGAPTYNKMFYAMPGIKIYTNLNSPNKGKFSVNPALVVAAGNGINPNPVNLGYSYDQEVTQSRFMLGALVNAGWNYFPTNHLYLGFDFGLGARYLNNYGGVNAGFNVLAQSSFRVGYRYHTGNKIIDVLK